MSLALVTILVVQRTANPCIRSVTGPGFQTELLPPHEALLALQELLRTKQSLSAKPDGANFQAYSLSAKPDGAKFQA